MESEKVIISDDNFIIITSWQSRARKWNWMPIVTWSRAGVVRMHAEVRNRKKDPVSGDLVWRDSTGLIWAITNDFTQKLTCGLQIVEIFP